MAPHLGSHHTTCLQYLTGIMAHHHQYVCIDHSLKVHAKVLKLSPLLSKNELLTIIADHNLTYVYKFRKYYVYS